jgi:cell wall-associated NlpC family hydrolase
VCRHNATEGWDDLKNHRLRWALLCVAATHGALLSTYAEATTTVVIKPGDSIDSLARKYRVSKRDIAQANGISVDALLIDGRKLIIPDPPKPYLRKPTMKRAATLQGNRVAIRMAPNTEARRLTLLDYGAPLVVTCKEDGWLQVMLEDGQQGWVRADFVSMGVPLVAARSPKAKKPTSKRTAAAEWHDKLRPSRRKTKVVHLARHGKKRAASKSLHPLKNRRGQRQLARAPANDLSPESNSSSSSTIVRTAFSYRGARYRYGGSSQSGFDCSGFTRHVYAKNGIYLPHSSSAQAQCGKRVSKNELQAGDLVFFSTTRRGISHVGIYVGNGQFVHASSSRGRVRVDSLNEGYYRERYRGARRVK